MITANTVITSISRTS